MVQNILGWYGIIGVLTGYMLITVADISSKSILYQMLNLTASACLAYTAFKCKAKHNLILNIIWASIALTATLIVLLKK